MKHLKELTHAELQALVTLARRTGFYNLTPRKERAARRVLALRPWEAEPYHVLPCWKVKGYSTAWLAEPPARAALQLRAELFEAAGIPDPYAIDGDANE